MKTMPGSTLALALLLVSAGASAESAKLTSFTVCADPGNMPLSNNKREGYQNKIADVIGEALGTGVQYYWRPSIERGLMRTTLSQGNCDLWLDMASDTEGAEVLTPLYRSTFVFAYRNDKGYHFKNLDDPKLGGLKIGVFQVSAVRQALAAHGVVSNTVIHYLSHNGDLVPENQPSYQVQQMIDGTLDIAAVWGPMAGYYKTIKHAPITILPLNTIDDTVPLEFDMAMAVPRGRPELKQALERAMRDKKAEIRKILDDYGVPLVVCDDCIISGDLPSHGPYQPLKPTKDTHKVTIAQLKQWLHDGANPDDELGNAIVADDMDRVKYLLDHGAHPDARDGDGYTALGNAIRFGFTPIALYLLDHKADPNKTDLSGWSPLMYAAWSDDADMVKALVGRGAKTEVTAEANGLTPLAIAAQNGKNKAAAALIDASADIEKAVGQADYTPLMLTAISGSADIAKLLIKKGAHVNAKNGGGVTALMIAAAHNRADVAQVLIDSGADPGAKSEDGRSALNIAESANNDAMVKILRKTAGREKST